jgi:hypothetical protein
VIFLINTLLLHIPLLALTDSRNDRQRIKLILVGLGNLWFLQVNHTIPSTHAEKNYQSFFLLHISLLALTDRWNDRQRNEYTCCAWAGGTLFPVVPLCQLLVLAGNRYWFYILTYLEYNTVVALCQFFGSGGK